MSTRVETGALEGSDALAGALRWAPSGGPRHLSDPFLAPGYWNFSRRPAGPTTCLTMAGASCPASGSPTPPPRTACLGLPSSLSILSPAWSSLNTQPASQVNEDPAPFHHRLRSKKKRKQEEGHIAPLARCLVFIRPAA